MTELRCPSRILAVVTEDGLLEVKCSSKYCGAGNGTVVLHYFDLETLQLKETKTYNNPERLFRK
jgi:hypothetical protein